MAILIPSLTNKSPILGCHFSLFFTYLPMPGFLISTSLIEEQSPTYFSTYYSFLTYLIMPESMMIYDHYGLTRRVDVVNVYVSMYLLINYVPR